MAQFVHTIKITEMKKKLQFNNQTDVICHARWRLTSYRTDYPDTTAIFDGATPFQISASDLNPDNFTSFDNLTEAQIITWVEANASNLGDLKLKNEDKINSELEGNEVSVIPPWGDSIFDSGPNVETTNEEPTPPEDVANMSTP